MIRKALRWLGTFFLLLMATAAGGQYAVATTEHDFPGQLWALITGASFLLFAIVRIINDTREGE